MASKRVRTQPIAPDPAKVFICVLDDAWSWTINWIILGNPYFDQYSVMTFQYLIIDKGTAETTQQNLISYLLSILDDLR